MLSIWNCKERTDSVGVMSVNIVRADMLVKVDLKTMVWATWDVARKSRILSFSRRGGLCSGSEPPC